MGTDNFSVEIDGREYRPKAVSEVQLRGRPQSTSVTDQCGNTETYAIGNSGIKLTVTGVITESQRGTNLSLDLFKNDIMSANTINVSTDLYTGDIRVQEPTGVTQTSGDRDTDERGTKQYAFTMTLGEPQSQ